MSVVCFVLFYVSFVLSTPPGLALFSSGFCATLGNPTKLPLGHFSSPELFSSFLERQPPAEESLTVPDLKSEAANYLVFV